VNTEIVKASETLPVPLHGDDVVVLARNPEEMATAQQGLLSWADAKIRAEQANLDDAQTNLNHAVSMKIRTEGWKRQVSRAKKLVLYYTKMRSALEEGYCIVPNFPIQIIATKTGRKLPKPKKFSNSWNVPAVAYDALPQGEGRYVDPNPTFISEEVEKERNGRTETVTVHSTYEFQEDIDFPFKTVKPQILSDLDRALKLKLFDEIGVLPQAGRRKGDPMIIGQIKRRDGTYQETVTSFLITWWVDSRDL
jgi:hypothetical protein